MMKDFYDIYYLARTFDFDGAKLQTAISRTLERRGTLYEKDNFRRILSCRGCGYAETLEILFEGHKR